jgi:tyrosinase
MGMTAMPFALWLQKERIPFPPLRRKWVRYEARSTEGQKMLKIYADTVNQMMNSTTAGDPHSWIFQWYTHWVRGDRTKAGELTSIYGSGSSPNKTLANDMWNTCRAHFSWAPDEDFFLPWHRMYVYFFESIIRKLSGHMEFSLPYWNYSVSGANHGVIPPQFTQGSDPTYKWLYKSDRNPGVNTGTPIDSGSPGDLDLTALKESTYQQNGAAQGFNMALDFGLHGNVHVDTGDYNNMGDIHWAAGDPIFWMHHCNIDRLWASWNKNGGVNPGGAWLTKQFTFADANGSAVTGTVSNFDSLAKLDYTYDYFEPPPRIWVPIHWPYLVAHPTPLQIHELAEVPLGPSPLQLRFKPAPELREPFAAHIAKLAPEKQRIYLVIKKLRADVQPGVVYEVFLDVPQGRSPREAREHQVGVINFFHFAGHEHQEGAPGFFSFDITEVVKNLHERKLLQAEPVVSIVPRGQPAANAKPVVGEISIVEQPAPSS